MIEIEVHPLTEDPTKAWKEMTKKSWISSILDKMGFAKGDQEFQVMDCDLGSLKKDDFPNEDTIRIVCVSDTHSQTSKMKHVLPDGDVLIHAGDFTLTGHVSEVKKFHTWLGTLPYKHKIVIAGNHDMSLDPSHDKSLQKMFYQHYSNLYEGGLGDGDNDLSAEDMKKLLTNCVYLEDSWINLYGYKIYGSPWTPEFGSMGFSFPRGAKMLEKWYNIPDDTDILVTHGPPLSYGDLTNRNLRAGCSELLNTIRFRVKPKYHIYGHIHEGHGVRSNGTTTFINPAICQGHGSPSNPPIVFDLTKLSKE